VRRRPPLWPVAVALGLAACGGGGAAPDDDAVADLANAPRYVREEFKPRLRAPRLAVLERRSTQFGRVETLEVGRDGSAVLVRDYGGGGFVRARCRLAAPELAGLRADLTRLPAGPPVARRLHHPHPYIYAVRVGGHTDSAREEELPDALVAPARLLDEVLTARAASCRKVWEFYR
jgi:hypothetical protein